MAKECMKYLKDRLDMSAAMSRLNSVLLGEWKAYRRYLKMAELTRLRRRQNDEDDLPTACYPLC